MIQRAKPETVSTSAVHFKPFRHHGFFVDPATKNPRLRFSSGHALGTEFANISCFLKIPTRLLYVGMPLSLRLTVPSETIRLYVYLLPSLPLREIIRGHFLPGRAECWHHSGQLIDAYWINSVDTRKQKSSPCLRRLRMTEPCDGQHLLKKR